MFVCECEKKREKKEIGIRISQIKLYKSLGRINEGKTQRAEWKSLCYITTNEAPGELSRENMIFPQITCYNPHTWKDHRCYDNMLNRTFLDLREPRNVLCLVHKSQFE